MMTETKTKTAATPHGDLEYEVVECDSCGSEIRPEDAYEFRIGDRYGVACDYCADEGPMSFPEKVHQLEDPTSMDEFVIFFLLWPIILIVAIFDCPNEHAQGFRNGVITGIPWIVILSYIAFNLIL